MRTRIFLTLALFLCACGPDLYQRQILVQNQASRDLHCPKDKIKLNILKSDSDAVIWGKKLVIFNAEGCGKKQVYDNLDLQVYKSFGK